ncbi:MAG: pitrilysin family protein [Polyangiaceae bacterium]
MRSPIRGSRGAARALALLACIVSASACGGGGPPDAQPPGGTHGAGKQLPPTPATSSTVEAPPPSGPPRAFLVPKPTWVDLAGGMRLATVESKTLPLVQLRVVVLGGRSADGERPGLAALTGELLKDGGSGNMSSRELLSRIESLGGSLSIDTRADKTTLGLAVTKDAMAEALSLLATVVTRPRLDAAELGRLKKRETERVANAARTSGRWAASMVLWRDLFTLPAERHPYAAYDATGPELDKLTVADCRSFHQRFYVPKNMFVVVAGDTTAALAKDAVDKAFTGFHGGDPPPLIFTAPVPQGQRPITVVHRPNSKQSDIYVALLGPERKSPAWTETAVANQVLGGGVASRLFVDVREKQSLAYTTWSSLVEVANGPVPFIAHAGTQTPKTGLALEALLAHVHAIGQGPPSAEEVETASRYLGDTLAIRIETIGAVADEVVSLRTLGLPDDYYDGYRRELREVTPPLAARAAAENLRDAQALVVVAGDADRIGPLLSRFGEVKVVDPVRNFERVRSIPRNPDAPRELPREAGE